MFSSIKKFDCIDMDLHATDEADVIYGTSNSHVELQDGRVYENQYVFIVKLKDGLITHNWEYLRRFPIMECFKEELAKGRW
jgi:ketosteroid isomerase-like protein